MGLSFHISTQHDAREKPQTIVIINFQHIEQMKDANEVTEIRTRFRNQNGIRFLNRKIGN